MSAGEWVTVTLLNICRASDWTTAALLAVCLVLIALVHMGVGK